MGEQDHKTPEAIQLLAQTKSLKERQIGLEAKIRNALKAEQQAIDEDFQKLALVATQWLTDTPEGKFADKRALNVIETAIQNGVDAKDLYWLLTDGQTTFKLFLKDAKQKGENEKELPEFWYLSAWQIALGGSSLSNLPLYCVEARRALVHEFVQKAKALAETKGEDKKAKLLEVAIPFLIQITEKTSRVEH